ncbi:MAG TPA: hypothetical protein PKO28_04625 [Bacilli bacterium]|nr:hypothetical protein [Bacilli bacterium]
MKKSLLFIPILLLGSGLLTGCSLKDRVQLTYGSYIQEDLVSLENFSDLQAKMSGVSKGENFLLATYLKGGVCSCWDNFETVLKRYIYEENVVIYKISNDLFNSNNQDDLDEWGLTKIAGTTPSLAVIQNGKVKKEFIDDNSTFFSKYIPFKEKIDQYVLAPNYYYVDQNILDDAIQNEDKLLVHYMWNFCPDCNYCAPEVLHPYSNKHTLKLKMYVIDIGSLTGYDPNSENPFENFDTSNEEYVTFLRDHHMSAAGDSTFGDRRGFVPTTQYWENGVLTDASVYFNDALTLVGEQWTVTDSFYTEERKSSLHYLDGVKTTVLKGLAIDADDVTPKQGNVTGSWNKDAAAVYHNPLLIAFLDTYAL